MQRPHMPPAALVMRQRAHFSASLFQLSSPLHIGLGPAVIAPDGRVVGRQRLAAGIVRVVSPVGHGAQAYRVDAQVVGGSLQVVGVALRVGGAGRHGAARLAELQQQQGAQRPARAGADGALHHAVGVLGVGLHGLAQVAEQRTGEEVGALGKARHPGVVDEGGGLVLPFECLEREGAAAKVAASTAALALSRL
jgi:hypothetical protein